MLYYFAIRLARLKHASISFQQLKKKAELAPATGCTPPRLASMLPRHHRHKALHAARFKWRGVRSRAIHAITIGRRSARLHSPRFIAAANSR